MLEFLCPFGASYFTTAVAGASLRCGAMRACAIGMDAVGKPHLLDRVRQAIRPRHYSSRTEEAYVGWIRRFILFHKKWHPADMGEMETNAFLSELASAKHVSASTQMQALCALMFLHKEVLGRKTEWIEVSVRLQRPARLPVVLTREEVRSLLGTWTAYHG